MHKLPVPWYFINLTFTILNAMGQVYLFPAQQSSLIYSSVRLIKTYAAMLFAIFAFCFTAGSQARDLEPRYWYAFDIAPGYPVDRFASPEDAYAWLKSHQGDKIWLDQFPEPGPSLYNGAPYTKNGRPTRYNAHYMYPGNDHVYTWATPGNWGGLSIQIECPKGTIDRYSGTDGPDTRVYCWDASEPVEPDCNSCGESVGKPIYPSTGVERHTETDYQGEGVNTLRFTRTYRSDHRGWLHNYQIFGIDFTARPREHGLCYQGVGAISGEPYCYKYFDRRRVYDFAVRRGNGRMLDFGTATSLAPTADINDRVTKTVDGWTVHNAESETTERFNFAGQLESITDRNGQVQTFTYSDANTPSGIAPRPGFLIEVADAVGNALHFTYDSTGRMIAMTDPMGGKYTYAYDEVSSIVLPGKHPANNLTSVTFPDGKKRTYWYNEQGNTSNTDLPFSMTGITDENGARFATIQYDSYGKAISTALAGNVQHYTVKYLIANLVSLVTDPLGTERRYDFSTALGVVRIKSKSQPGGTSFSASENVSTYDDNGNLATYTDYNNVKTIYTYDLSRNLETKRVEASGTPQARTITTSWHPIYRLPVTVFDPLKVTKFTYDDANGNLLQKTVQATKDTTGAQGAAAAVIGSIRTWKYTYNTAGQIRTVIEPGDATTTFNYDAKGNLQSIENALKQVTKYSNYDANGRAGRIEDPNGLVQDLTYTSRGWLETSTTKGRQWRYAYDGVGQLTRVDSPDGSVVNYFYDDAHRLTKVTDSLGNSITYTLDAMGNRTAEEVKDSSNSLVRKVSRTYDNLNRLKQQVGGAL